MESSSSRKEEEEGVSAEQDHDRALRMARFLDSGSLRASLYRNKLQKVLLNPNEPLTNPYRVSPHDQMPVRVIPPSPAGKSLRRRSVANSLIPRRRKTKLPDQKTSDFQNENSLAAVSSQNNTEAPLLAQPSINSFLKPQNRTTSFDSLIHKPHYLTRNALKRIKEQKFQDLNESNFSMLSDEENQTHDFSSQSGIRASKSRKSFHKFNIFSKSSKVKSVSELALNEAQSFENLDATAAELNATSLEKEEKKRLRKRRLSGFRSRFQKKSSDEDKSMDVSKRKSNKRKSSVFQNVMFNEEDPVSLQDVLTNRGLCDEFRDFLSHEHSDENLDFWTMCEKYKTSSNQKNLAEVIRGQFLNDGAPREVNLDAKTKFVLQEKTRVLTNESFVAAQESIYRLMEEDSFRRFASTRKSKRRKRI